MILGKADEPWSTGMCIPVFGKLEHVRSILQPSSIIQIFDIKPQRKQDLVMFNRERPREHSKKWWCLLFVS